MPELLLDGCRTEPLGAYLTGLGLLRTVTRTLDADAACSWRDQRFVLHSRFESVDDLVEELTARFEPESIVSPWNAGSGFAGNGKNVTAERALQKVRDSDDPRLIPLAQAVRAGDEVVRRGRALGWGGKGEDLWDKARKVDVLRLCRNTFPDHALAWLDAAVALGSENIDPTYSRLLGTGGNFGRQDLSATYFARAVTALDDRRSRAWLRAAIAGDESVPYLRDSVGQFDPARAGGIQSSPWEKADDKGFVNPWSFLLTIEGALLFAGAVVRRHGTQLERPALPFQVRGSTAGFVSAADGETALGEIWLPEWSEPAELEEITHLLAEGRAEWRDGPARSGLDFARAAASLGVDRGIDAFARHVFVDRLGQNPLAVPAGRIEVRRREGVGLLAGLDPWLERLRGARMPAGVAAGVRRVEHRLFDLAAGTGGLVDVLAAVGRLTESLARSGMAQEAAYPLELRRGHELWELLHEPMSSDVELRLAVAFAALSDPRAPTDPAPITLRPLLQPVRWHATGRWMWTGRAAPAPLSMGLGPALAEAARRRAFPGAVREWVTDRHPGVRGTRIVFGHGPSLGTADRLSLVTGTFDEDRCAALLSALLCIRWSVAVRGGSAEPRVVDRDGSAEPRRMAGDDSAEPPSTAPGGSVGSHATSLDHHLLGGAATVPVPALDVLLPFATSGSAPMLVRPGSEWPTLLVAGQTSEVLADAARRLRIGGLRFVIEPAPAALDPNLLAASLMLPSLRRQREAALAAVGLNEEEIA